MLLSVLWRASARTEAFRDEGAFIEERPAAQTQAIKSREVESSHILSCGHRRWIRRDDRSQSSDERSIAVLISYFSGTPHRASS